MTQYRTYLDDLTLGGQETILSIQQNGSKFGVGLSTDIVCNNISAGIVSATNLIVSGITTVGLASTSSPSNSQMSFELTNNTTLTIRVRGSDGVVRSGIVTLS
jgi:hypothetical protein